MAGLFDKQADIYLDARPTYPSDWYSMMAALTPHHSLAWDVGTGNGQAAIGVSPFFPPSFPLIPCTLNPSLPISFEQFVFFVKNGFGRVAGFR